jgi:hypothetical protein
MTVSMVAEIGQSQLRRSVILGVMFGLGPAYLFFLQHRLSRIRFGRPTKRRAG